MRDVDQARLIDRDPVCRVPFDVIRDGTPVVMTFVSEFSRPDHDWSGSRLIRSMDEEVGCQRRGRCSTGSFQKITSLGIECIGHELTLGVKLTRCELLGPVVTAVSTDNTVAQMLLQMDS